MNQQSRHNTRMKQVMNYIETHLDDNPTLTELSAIACYSEFHFQRLFQAFVGEPVYAYKRRLLLERAVRKLRYPTLNITEIALQSGFETASAFNKSFKNSFAYTPSQIRLQRDIALQYPPALKKRSLNMKADIQQLTDINVISARGTGAYSQAAKTAWETLMPFAYGNRLMKKEIRSFGIGHDNPQVTAAENLRYDACLDIEGDISDYPTLQKQVISGGKYALFLHKGAYETLSESYNFIYNDWLMNSDFELRDIPCFEEYLNRDPRKTKPENLKTLIYIPLK
ncbi:AraC family transcriptional regulator [Psychromonas sp. Urea-02u-13]|uniref:AraC family transcriptional regulator n=1 Tax=Psychromonas sp. Urea-02u-13 TaxID=2058326 RepID=UPI0018E3801F|nr:AraC family transcriptional regulator [Psychromonas sp. Urea-02u-13]